MKIILIILSILSMSLLTSCTAMQGSIDLGFIKIPMFIVFAAIIIYIIYRRNHR